MYLLRENKYKELNEERIGNILDRASIMKL